MRRVRQGLKTSTEGFSVSGTPSEVPEAVLPYGVVPSRLSELEATVSEMSTDLQGRINALAENANELKYTAPLNSCMCWQEVGRLLERHAGLLAEAWLCYSRAVSLVPDHKPSLTALRRLARIAGAHETLELLLEASIDRATNAVELAGMNTELATLSLEQNNTSKALDELREAVRAYPDALAAHFLKIGVAASEQDDEELLDTLSAVLDYLGDSQFASDVVLTLSLIEERLGKLDSAFERLRHASVESRLSLPGYWALFRLCLRLDLPEDAVAVADRLVASADEPRFKGAFKRIRAALTYLLLEQSDTDFSSDLVPDDPVWDLQTLGMAKREELGKSAAAAVRFIERTNNRQLREIAAVAKVAHSLSLGIRVAELDPNIDPHSVPGRAISSFLGLSLGQDPYDKREEDPEASIALSASLEGREFEEVATILASLRADTSSPDDRWTLAVAEAAVRIVHLEQTEESLRLLREEASHLNQAPLPVLIRAFDPTSQDLAELALAEAMDSEDEKLEAVLIAWAGYHSEEMERDEAGRLFQRALSLDPEQQFAILGLERTVSDKSLLAEACLNGALVAGDQQKRLRFLVRAGIHFMAAGSGSRAAELFAEALTILPSDRFLFETVLRLALTYPSVGLASYVAYDEDQAASKSVTEMFSLGSLALDLEPETAVLWFARALAEKKNDPLALQGLVESQLAAGRATVISSDLLAKLRNTEDPRVEAATYGRLACIDRFYQNDPSSSILSLVSLHEKLPGHQTTLVRLVTHFLSQGSDEIDHVLSALGNTVADDDDSVALIIAAWRNTSPIEDTLRTIVEKNSAAVLEATQLEGMTEDAQAAINLLETLKEVTGGTHGFVWRLAERYGDFGYPEKAIKLYDQLLDTKSEKLFELYCLSLHQRVAGNYQGLLGTLRWMAEESRVPSYQLGVLWDAVEICRTNLQNYIWAAELCIQILSIAPDDTRAFQLGLELLVKGDPAKNAGKLYHSDPDQYDLLVTLMTSHLYGIDDVVRKSELYQEIAVVLLSSGQEELRQRALTSIHTAVGLVPDDITGLRWLANLYCEDHDWMLAIEQLLAAARIVRDPGVGCEIFYQLGSLYLDHTDRADLAEKSFIKVLGWNRSHFEAMERIGELYLRTGKTGRAVQAWEHCVHLATDTPTKISKMVELARLKTKYLGATQEAERLLCEARRLDPYDMGPLEALAKLFKTQQDPLALYVHLDSALAQQASILKKHPDRLDVYHAIKRILTLRGEESLVAMASDAIGLVEGTYIERGDSGKQAYWDVGTRIADPVYNEFICPTTVPAGLRQTMKTLGEPLASLVGVATRQMNLDRYRRLDKRSLLFQLLAEMAPGFRVSTPAVYVGSDPQVSIAPGTPSAVIVSSFVADTKDEAIVRFVSNYMLKMISLGLSLATIIPTRQLRLLMSAVVRLSVPNYQPDGIDPQDLIAQTERTRQSLPGGIIASLRPFTFDCMEALKEQRFSEQLLSIGYRAGFIGAGSLPGALRALRVLSGSPTGPLANVRGAGEVMGFVFTRAHVEMRMRLGI